MSASVPGPGPAWFGAVMGTGGLTTLMQLHAVRVPGFAFTAAVGLVLSWLMLIGLGAGFARSIARDPHEWSRSIRDATMVPLWGMVSMGYLAVGAATLVVVHTRIPSWAPIAFWLDVVFWIGGTILGLATAIGFAIWLFTRRPDHPLPTWALPMVPPMVSATVGGVIAGHIRSDTLRTLLISACVLCFVVALALGTFVIVRAYHHAWFRTPVPVALATSTWIPLGIVGQSAAASQVLSGPALAGLARAYSGVVLVAGAGLGLYAIVVTIRGFLARMPFAPGWWAMAYPLSTCGLGSYFLGWQWASLVTVAVLIIIWLVCAAASVRAIAMARHA